MNRRHALKVLSTLCASGIITQRLPARAQVAGGNELTYGLLFGEEALPRIRSNFNSNPLFASLREQLTQFDRIAEYAFIENELRYNDQLVDIARLGRTAEAMAFLYLMTGDEEAARLATRATREIMNFQRWDFFLDGDQSIGVQRAPSSTIATALAADFLGSRITESERREWIHTMGERGCEACYRGLYGIVNPQDVIGWRFDPESTFYEHRPNYRTDMNRRPEITRDTNLRAVPASALVIGSLAHQLEFGKSSKTRRWLAMGRENLEVFKDIFQPDGSYHEEANYGHYTAEHIQQAAVALARHTPADLTDVVDWDAYVDFQLNMTMPTHGDPYGVVNWGDSGSKPGQPNSAARTSLPFWVAAINKNGLAQWLGRNLAGSHTFWSAVWHDPSVEARAPEAGPQLWVSDLDRVVARTGYGVDDLVVAMRSGPPANHEHADRNSLIVKCYGEQLVADPARPPYSYMDPSWRLRLTGGHSAVLVDGKGHEHHNGVEGTNPSQSYARITHQLATPAYAVWASDASQPYRLVNADVKKVVRSVAVLYGEPAVVVVDHLVKFDRPSTLTSRYFGYNYDGLLDREVHRHGFLLDRPHASLKASAWSSTGFEIAKGRLDIEPGLADKHPCIDIHTGPGKEILLVTVLSLGRDPSKTEPASFTPTADGVTLAIGRSKVSVAPDGLKVLA